ncbi:hypothetical protein EV356DRAFT_530849 [Viridothelium virens]|uniref:SnoaL-like domain-containing protein n=1 Tax=Viridothelium virens TaxID=1048519 RepID=A0A6A6HFG1_VIRVR|nr:hypothetical protein EV356DRAFT_530849 [Viridothelium virens]
MHFAALVSLVTLLFATLGLSRSEEPSQQDFSSLSRGDVTWVLLSQTVNTYAELVDQKRFDQLDRVFSQDAVAHYSGSYRNLQGLPAICSALALSYSNMTTQHLVGSTVHVPNDTHVLAASAFQVTIWDRNNKVAGQYFGYYFDQFSRRWSDGGFGGFWTWVIQERRVRFLGPGPTLNGTIGG